MNQQTNSTHDSIHTYDDIIHLPHPDPKTHPRMPVSERAAQFSPFAALSGHQEAIREAERMHRQSQ
ncbi:hypothetical protein C823_002650 [Eubacterium plexicaudatum ASF492]|uniref:Uncharacterized protein n=1 Tax=Eubacterium plexicaudatum ASF492 TaxID=1235802 RepID=N2AEG8_9FIRM|nr:hypothetical protein C823_002650 [Eubacterium plexicaudatum ASF492]